MAFITNIDLVRVSHVTTELEKIKLRKLQINRFLMKKINF